MLCSYERFLSEGFITKDQFFDFGIRETIYAPLDVAKERWEQLKKNIHNNKVVYMRGFGRNAAGSHLYLDFYKHVFGHTCVQIDPTNNKEPAAVIRDLTGYSKVKSPKYQLLRNYQISHIFGRTKNIYAFTAPWNIVYLPKILDPLTGHEASGEMIDEYTNLFQRKSYAYFESLIEDYNQLITENAVRLKMDKYLEEISQHHSYLQADIDKLVQSISKELTPILI